LYGEPCHVTLALLGQQMMNQRLRAFVFKGGI
jgi:hypothetical protein